jgi:putative transcription factor
MTQKQLGAAICEHPKIIQEYECGKAKPNGQILAKLDKALGVRLPRGK